MLFGSMLEDDDQKKEELNGGNEKSEYKNLIVELGEISAMDGTGGKN